MTAALLNQMGLVLGLISGLLLIPEIFNLIPFEYLEKKIEAWLNNLETNAKFPIKLHPPSWKILFSEEQREKFIEPITAVSGLIFSIIWVGTTIFGIIKNSGFFILFGLIPPFYVTIRKILDFRKNVLGAKRYNIIGIFFFAIFAMLILSPFTSLLRVIFLIIRFSVNSVKNTFSKYKHLRKALTIFAIISFIISNILQLIATLYE